MTPEEFETRVMKEVNSTKYKSIDPGICPDCLGCQCDYGMTGEELVEGLESGNLPDEGSFSWWDCELCGNDLGGDRYVAHGWTENNIIIHYDICVDCLQYLTNGTLLEQDSD